MVKPGPMSKKKEIIREIRNLLSKKTYGVRELHRALPIGHRAESFTTLYSCINELKSNGDVDQDPVTKKLRLTEKGNATRQKQSVIDDVEEERTAVGRNFFSSTFPVVYRWSFVRDGGDIRSAAAPLMNVLQTDLLETTLLDLSNCLRSILEIAKEEGLIGEEQLAGRENIPNSLFDKLWKEKSLPTEVLNIISIDLKKLLDWLKTPPGAAMLKYVLKHENEEAIEEIQKLVQQNDKLEGLKVTRCQTLNGT